MVDHQTVKKLRLYLLVSSYDVIHKTRTDGHRTTAQAAHSIARLKLHLVPNSDNSMLLHSFVSTTLAKRHKIADFTH